MSGVSTFVLLFVAVVGIYAAPTTIIQAIPAASHQYLLLQPQPSALKLQPQLIHPIQHLAKLETQPQLIYYYPTVPLATAPLQTLSDKPQQLLTLQKQEEFAKQGWGEQFNNFFFGTTTTTEMPAPAEENKEPEAEGEAQMKLQSFVENEKDAEQIPQMSPGTPASTVPLEKRYYIISGHPQFFGNFDALQNPLSPIFSLQPLQAIQARSALDSSKTNIEALNDQILSQPQIVSAIAPIEPVPADVPQLKSDLLESNQEKELSQLIARSQRRFMDDDEETPEQKEVFQGRSQTAIASPENQPSSDEPKKEEPMKELSDDPAIAQARPSGIALAGRGGLASSSPVATAIVGKGGLALSSPSATSVAGDFLDEEEEADKKKE